MDNTIRKLVVPCLAVMGMVGGTVAHANNMLDFCHAQTFASLPATEVSNMFDLDKTGLANRLSAEKMMFTQSGYQGYLNALRHSGYLSAVQRGMKISARTDGKPTMSGPCSAPTVRIPAQFTYTNAQGIRHLQYTVAMMFQVGNALPMPKIAQLVVFPPLKLP